MDLLHFSYHGLWWNWPSMLCWLGDWQITWASLTIWVVLNSLLAVIHRVKLPKRFLNLDWGNGLWHKQSLVIFMPCVLQFMNWYPDSLKNTIVVFTDPMVSVCDLRKRDPWPHQCNWADVSNNISSCVTCWRLVPPRHGLHFICLGQ